VTSERPCNVGVGGIAVPLHRKDQRGGARVCVCARARTLSFSRRREEDRDRERERERESARRAEGQSGKEEKKREIAESVDKGRS
jgi:hypothetical protein